jgi:hypothetical protein
MTLMSFRPDVGLTLSGTMRLSPRSLALILSTALTVFVTPSGAEQAAAASAPGKAPAPNVTLALTDTRGLIAQQAQIDAATYKGRKAVRLTVPGKSTGFAVVEGSDFQDGTIEADLTVKVLPPGNSPGFVGIAFRTHPDASHYDIFYLRPGNAVSDDQSLRNHAVQYSATPNFDWYRLRRDWPMTYEAHVDLQENTWTHIKIVVKGRTGTLYVNNSPTPALVVDGFKGENLRGAVALQSYAGQEAYFSNLRITNAAPEPVQNGGEATGTWQVKFSGDAISAEGTLTLQRNGTAIVGTWSGDFGANLPVSGTWRDGYVELSFTGEWPAKGSLGKPGAASATLAGWIDGTSAKGRMRVDGRTEGPWKATRKP